MKNKLFTFFTTIYTFCISLLEKYTNYKYQQIIDSISISALLLAITKLIIYPFILLKWYFGILLYLFYISLTTKFNLLIYIREYFIVPLVENLVGYNFYRYNVCGPIDDDDINLRTDFPLGIKGDIYYNTRYYATKIGRKIYFFLIWLQIIFIGTPILYTIINNIIIICLIFNQYILFSIVLGIITNISRQVLLISDFTLGHFVNKIQNIWNINIIVNVLLPNNNNTKIIGFWVLRTLELREIRLLPLNEHPELNIQYMLEKQETHHLELKLQTIESKNIIFRFSGNYNEKKPSWAGGGFFFGFLAHGNILTTKFKIIQPQNGHYVRCHLEQLNNNEDRITLYAYKSHNVDNKSTTPFLGQTKSGENLKPNCITVIPENPPSVILTKSESDTFQDQCLIKNPENPVLNDIVLNPNSSIFLYEQFKKTNPILVLSKSVKNDINFIDNKFYPAFHYISKKGFVPEDEDKFYTCINLASSNKFDKQTRIEACKQIEEMTGSQEPAFYSIFQSCLKSTLD